MNLLAISSRKNQEKNNICVFKYIQVTIAITIDRRNKNKKVVEYNTYFQENLHK